jgi:exodeoxyribonuclease V alpha subunit
MVTSNDYARDLFNGDQGMVLRVQGEERGDHHYGVVFERGGAFVVHPLEPLRRVLDLAYAITTHKSQGSEFEDVMVVLPESPMPLLTREVLYTAVTRAKQSVVLVGSVDLLRIAAESPMIRHSALAQRLAVAGPQLNDLER